MSKQIRAQLIKKIEEVFADTKYPGDNAIVPLYNNQPHCDECAEMLEQFRGKNWRDIPIETIFRERGNLSLLTVGAFRYFLPAFMRAALSPSQTDTLFENIFFSLTPPRPNKANQATQQRFLELLEGFSVKQKSVLKEYVALYLQTETSYKTPEHRRAKKYWDVD